MGSEKLFSALGSFLIKTKLVKSQASKGVVVHLVSELIKTSIYQQKVAADCKWSQFSAVFTCTLLGKRLGTANS